MQGLLAPALIEGREKLVAQVCVVSFGMSVYLSFSLIFLFFLLTSYTAQRHEDQVEIM